MRSAVLLALLTLVPVGAQAQEPDASVTVAPPRVSEVEQGTRMVQDVTLATSFASYTLEYDAIRLKDNPDRIGFAMWAPTIGYTPLGIVSPSVCLWYFQGFFTWTLDDLNIQSYPATMRVFRGYGQDAMVEFTWDTEKAVVHARFAMTAGSDKLLLLGSYEPRVPIETVKLRLMSYPATFAQPWNRRVTTAVRTLSEGSGVPLDLQTERWLLLEDVTEGRPADGSAGLLLGDTTAFSAVTLDSIGGYGQFVDLTLKPERQSFVLGLYECPSVPDPEGTRDYFRRSADAENAALAALIDADPGKPLAALPVDEMRARVVAAREADTLSRPAEIWRPSDQPLGFPWAARLADGPVRVALLCPRWSAYDTMELARRLAMDVTHVYFDSRTMLTEGPMWPYSGQTGVGPLPAGLALREATRICADPTREVILLAGLHGGAVSGQVRQVILDRVRGGAGLVITGAAAALEGWPEELTGTPDPDRLAPAVAALSCESIPGLNDSPLGERLQGYRYGEGIVVVSSLPMPEYSSLVPADPSLEGRLGATDRALALYARVLLSAAGRPFGGQLKLSPMEAPAAAAFELPVEAGAGHDLLLRVQDGEDRVLHVGTQPASDAVIPIGPLPGGQRYDVDVLLRDADGNALDFAHTALDVPSPRPILRVDLSPSRIIHEPGPPVVDLANGGTLACDVTVGPGESPANGAARLDLEAIDAFDRVLARGSAPINGEGAAHVELSLTPPVTVCHRIESRLIAGDQVLAVRRDRFTIPVPYPYDDFTFLMWSYAGGEPVIARTDRLCYEMGADMMDLCHMGGHSDQAAAVQYALSSASGLRLVPYVTRIAGDATADHRRVPGLFDPAVVERDSESIAVTSRQAAAYAPAAYTLGDENYLCGGDTEVCAAPETMAEFRAWLQSEYGTIGRLNAAWGTTLGAFDEVTAPMWLDEAASQEVSFAPWFDFRAFMDSAFAMAHERCAAVINESDPGAKVGWDGLLGYHFQAGYDFAKLTRNLRLNQVYTTSPFQGELVRSLKQPGALTGEWGNAVADNEAGFSGIAWHNLFRGHNSCWWWTSWGCDYVPFNPDTSVSTLGAWYFRAARELRSGPGRLLTNETASRVDSPIAILYSQADMYAVKLASRVAGSAAFAGDAFFEANHVALERALEDMGFQYRYFTLDQIEHAPDTLKEHPVLFLPAATSLSDAAVEAIREFVRAGGTLVADGRVGLLTERGQVRAERPLDDVFGVTSPAGRSAFATGSQTAEVPLGGQMLRVDIMEPGIATAAGAAAPTASAPILIRHSEGKGEALLLNLPFTQLAAARATGAVSPMGEAVRALLAERGFRPFAELTTPTGPARAVEQVVFGSGGAEYLCLEQDIHQPQLPGQELTIRIPKPAFVYDVRAGRRIGEGRVDAWQTPIARGDPRVFALLPYEVRSVAVEAPARATLGQVLAVPIQVAVSEGEPGPHVVAVSVFVPGGDRPHREYSCTVLCPKGVGEFRLPIALNDPTGTWRIVCRDVASGVTAESVVDVSE